MGRIALAFRAFFGILFSGELASRVRPVMTAEPNEAPEPKKLAPAPVVTPPRNTCSEALLLLAALQREARLVDFVNEPIDAYTDEQVGAAVREIHRESAKVLQRVFGLKHVVEQEEGSSVDIPAGYDAARFRLTGKVDGEAPFTGQLVHHGWEATACQLPAFGGEDGAANVIAPAEVEI